MTVFGAHPQRLDIYVHPGDPIAIAIPVLDSTGATQSLSGWTAAATVKAPDGQLLHDFAPSIASDQIQVAATSAQTTAWSWPVYAARLVITATPPAGAAAEIASGWIRLYNP
jgi:hypothetical protein